MAKTKGERTEERKEFRKLTVKEEMYIVIIVEE